MRTPWRFFSNLVLRKAPEDQKSGSRDKARNVIAIEHRPAEDQAIANAGLDGSTVVQNGTDTVAPAAEQVKSGPVTPAELASENAEQTVALNDAQNAVAIEAANDIDPDHPNDSAVSDVAETGPVELTTTAKPERMKRSVKAPVAHLPTTLPEEAHTAKPVAESTIEGEIFQLNQEISELRRCLSEKLVIQNAQLKRLLDRFQD
jgi:hypothetical protein